MQQQQQRQQRVDLATRAHIHVAAQPDWEHAYIYGAGGTRHIILG
jgi:hypothetical protein